VLLNTKMPMRSAECGMRNGRSAVDSAFRIPHSAFGFTLIELLVVLVVIGLLAGLVGPMVFRNVSDAKVTTARAQLELLSIALEQYRLDNGWYPSSAQGLEALRMRPEGDPTPLNWRGPYLRKAVPMDPWGRPYVYRSPSESNAQGFDLLSYGRDGRAGGEGEDGDVAG
jgi:general secretion pathway protein G